MQRGLRGKKGVLRVFMEFNKTLKHTTSLLSLVALPDSILPYKAQKRTAERKDTNVSGLHMWNNGENWTNFPRGEQAWKSHGLGRGRKFCE